jgi:hypothetical protein
MNTFKVHMGEVIKSIRPLLYRTNHHTTLGIDVPSGTRDIEWTYTFPRKPRHFGYDPNGMDTARNQAGSGNVPFNWVTQTPYTWLAPAFCYERGAHVWKIVGDGLDMGALKVTRNCVTSETSSSTFPLTNGLNLGTTTTVVSTDPRTEIISNYGIKSKGTGASVTSADVNNTLQVAAPLYSNYRGVTPRPMCTCIPPNTTVSAGIVSTLAFGDYGFNSANGRDFLTISGIIEQSAGTQLEKIELHHHVGVDFSLVFYRGCPRLFVYDDVPEAAV